MKQVTILRRFVAVLLALMLTLSLIPFAVTADPVSEAEPNNSKSAPNAVPLNTAINGVCATAGISADEDWYSINLPEDGYITLNFKHEALTTGEWTMQVKDEESSTLFSMNAVYDVTDTTSYRLGLAAGKYYIRLYSSSKSCAGVPYTLTVNFTATATYEMEPNNSKSTPNAIPVNTAIGGNCDSSGIGADNDWYSVNLPEDGYITLNFQHEAIRSGNWMVQIQDGEYGNFITEEVAYDMTDITTRRIGLPAGKYYVRVYTNDKNCVGVEYLLTVNFTATDTYELEPNDAKSEPNAIPVDTVIGGNISAGGLTNDEDWFSFRLSEDGKVAIQFTHDELKKGDWRVQVFNEDHALMIQEDVSYDQLSVISQRVSFEPGKYYICVESYDESCVGVEYTLTVLTKGMLGDVDGDGSITSTDSRLTLQYYTNKIGKDDIDLSVADVDGDGQYTSTDARLILQYYTGKIKKFPAEG